MNYERDDRLFEEAGRDVEKLDQLLLRSRRERKVASRILVGFVCLLLLVLAGLLCEVGRIAYSFWNFAKHHGPFPMPPPRLVAISHFSDTPIGVAMFLIAFIMALAFAASVGIGLRAADHRVKTLLLLRGLQEATGRASTATEHAPKGQRPGDISA